MKERPILFSAPMVKALLDGRKTQTRRIMKPQPAKHILALVRSMDPQSWLPEWENFVPGGFVKGVSADTKWRDTGMPVRCPYGKPGDRLWVKETFCAFDVGRVHYRADFAPDKEKPSVWKPSLFMPRWASRITLEITDVRVQRVEEITEEDAQAEGCGPDFIATAEWAKRHGHGAVPIAEGHRVRFLQLFYDINKRAGRGENPWVWCVSFRRIENASKP